MKLELRIQRNEEQAEKMPSTGGRIQGFANFSEFEIETDGQAEKIGLNEMSCI